MVSVIKKEIEIEESLMKKIEFICSFCNTTPIIENSSLITIERTKIGLAEATKEGHIPGHCPLGYKMVDKKIIGV